uniref:Right handed beta helix domain-containing protein n=1 Tax=Amphimedon queenslandica TaxID=400682 RepID=A0A1X7TYT1_AMPQE
MSLLLVVVLLFFSSSCSVSSHQYYVSNDCSSVTQSPCNPLSVYAGDMSQYNNSIFYFIGTSDINDDVNMTAVRNVTLHGLDKACLISSRSNKKSILIYNSSHVIISNMFFNNLQVIARSSNNMTISNSLFNGTKSVSVLFFIKLNNTFDVKVSSSVFYYYGLVITYKPLPVCSTELPHYSLILTNVTLFNYSWMVLSTYHGTSYNLSAIFHNYYNILHSYSTFVLGNSLLSFYIKNASFRSQLSPIYPLFIKFKENLKSVECMFPGIQLVSTFVIEDSQFCNNWLGPAIMKDAYLPRTLSNHLFIIIMKSCFISNNTRTGLFIDQKLMTLVQINIIDTEFIGNRANVISNSDAICLSNVTVANSTSTGLLLSLSLVTIENKLTFKHNTGVVGGGLAINDSSQLVLTSSANLEFIDNHASYKGGGIYVEETSNSGITLEASNIPLTLINNTAGILGDDIYGYTYNHGNHQFNLTNPNISSTGNVQEIYYCIVNKNASYKQIYPGQALKFHMALFGYDYFGSLNVTDGILEIRDGLTPDSAYTVDHVYARSKPDSNCSLVEYKPNHAPGHVKHTLLFVTEIFYSIYWDYIVNECPIGFSVDSLQGRFICSCSQSVSKENVTCNITSLNITHNGLLWIGTYDTSTTFNANATNPNACIINEDCLLYCSPNPVTFKLNDTDTQCVDNRGQRMCGSCREGYSLLMGSNKCGQCHDNYMVVAWIALFAVMGVLLVVLLIALNLTKYLSQFKLFKSWCRFKPIIDAYSGPMKDEYRFWPGLLLVARIPVLLTVTFMKNESCILLLVVAAIILSLSFIFGGVYRKKLNSLLHMKCYDALIKKLLKKQDEDDDPLLDVTESHLTVDQQRREIVPSSNFGRRESVVDLF